MRSDDPPILTKTRKKKNLRFAQGIKFISHTIIERWSLIMVNPGTYQDERTTFTNRTLLRLNNIPNRSLIPIHGSKLKLSQSLLYKSIHVVICRHWRTSIRVRAMKMINGSIVESLGNTWVFYVNVIQTSTYGGPMFTHGK